MEKTSNRVDRIPVHISFCTTCMGRTFHLRRTLPANLAILKHCPGSEILLLNYNSQDDMEDCIKGSFLSEIKSGLMSYYKTTEPTSFFMAHAKNVAHRLACRDILCNLDADHILTQEFVDEVIEVFSREPAGCILAAQIFNIAIGRTALPKKMFIELGGYNEEMCHGWGYEDNDLRIRAENVGIPIRWVNPASLSYLEHGDEERSANSVTKHISVSEKRHAKISEANIARRLFIANVGKHWGNATLTKNFAETVSI